MTTTTTQPVFTDTELPAEELSGPFRPSGLLCLILGIVSASALASPSLLIIPVVAILIGVFALRPARDRSLPPSGRGLAVLGIGTALFFASWSWSYFNAKTNFLVQDGRSFAVQWLETLRHGPTEYAFELTQLKAARQMESMPLEQYYTPENQMQFEQFDAFINGPAVSAVTSATTDPVWELDKVVSSYQIHQSEYIAFSFVDTTETVEPILIVLCCSPVFDSLGKPDPTKPVEWHVAEFSFYTP